MDKRDIVMPKLLEDNLKQLNLDLNLKSWTIHEKTDQVQLIIRFVYPANQNLKTTKSDTFVRKSKFHKIRDQKRMMNFNNLKSIDKTSDTREIKSASEPVPPLPVHAGSSNSLAPCNPTSEQVAQCDGTASSSRNVIQYESEPTSVKDYTPVVCSYAGAQKVTPSTSAAFARFGQPSTKIRSTKQQPKPSKSNICTRSASLARKKHQESKVEREMSYELEEIDGRVYVREKPSSRSTFPLDSDSDDT